MKKFLFLFLIVFLTFNAFSSHFIGGEITWECDTDPLSPNYGQYTFFLTIYQDCDGIDFSFISETINIHNHPSLSSVVCNFLTTNDISATGVAGTTPCYDCDNQPFGQFGAVKQWLYSSGPITITGTPPASGWHFTWGSCCRSSQLTQGMSDDEWTIRSVMYPYTDPSGAILPNNICHDNSPIFKEEPKTILCTGYPFSYSHLAFDVELDSLSYSWSEPLGDEALYDPNNPTAQALIFTAPYTVNSPIPGNPTLNNENGEISFFSNTSGIFVTCVKVAAFKCGQIVAEVFRDVNVALISCGTLPNGTQNSPPIISPPVGPQDWITSFNPSTGLPSYETTVMAGELVSFSVIATDNDINSTGNMQDLSLEVEGGQLDPLLALSNLATFTVTSSSPGNIAGDFSWPSNCDHMQDYGCGRQGGTYTFNLKAYDDFCPANGIVIATITINVTPPAPDLRCLAVDESGGVELSFFFPQGVIDTNISYDIYYSKQLLGPYELIDSVFYPQSQYYHANSDADISKSYYYLLGSVTCGLNLGTATDSLLYSDTLSTIFMNATTVNFGLSADLEWNPIHDPLLPSSSTEYDLHYININNLDNIIVNTPDLFYQMDGDTCNYVPEFYVEISDASGCISRSSIANVALFDTLSPVTPFIENVSVNALGQSELTWSTSANTGYYVIYMQNNNGVWVTMDTVSSLLNTYVYENSEATSNIEIFQVRALDSCGNSRVASLEHNSILLKNTSNPCDYTVLLEWNDYINWIGGTHHYNIVISETDLNGSVVMDTIIRVQGESQFILEDISSSSNYNIVVEAYNNDSTFKAVSNILNINVAIANKPLFNYIEYTTVNHQNGSVDLSCIVDVNAVIDRYDVYRSLNYDDVFSKVGEVSFSAVSPIVFNDKSVSTNDYFYKYKIYPVDTCGQTLAPPSYNFPPYLNDTSFAQTILLQANINEEESNYINEGEYTNKLIFNKYDKWLGDVSEYRLYRSVNREPFNLLPLYVWDRVNNPEEDLEYLDIVTEFGNGNGRFCYYIQAIEGVDNPYGSTLEGSFSNIACVSQIPIIFVPSSFTPNSDEHNEIFKPITYFVSEIGYLFSIYNRSGEKIFETNNPQKGWDGTHNGLQIPNGNYVYHIQFLNSVGDLTEKTDFITLIR